MIKFFIPHRLEGEYIIILVRRHFFIILIKMLLWLLVAILPLIFYYLLGNVVISFLPAELVAPLLILGASIFYLYLWLFIFFSFVDYYLDVWIVTNERIIDIELKGLFDWSTSEQKLYRVQDVTAEIKGFFGTFLSFGDVSIQTAAEEERFIFKQVPHPDLIAKKINSLAEDYKKIHHIIPGAV